jgi:hypothetical protein
MGMSGWGFWLGMLSLLILIYIYIYMCVCVLNISVLSWPAFYNDRIHMSKNSSFIVPVP